MQLGLFLFLQRFRFYSAKNYEKYLLVYKIINKSFYFEVLTQTHVDLQTNK